MQHTTQCGKGKKEGNGRDTTCCTTVSDGLVSRRRDAGVQNSLLQLKCSETV